jgi:hypothetical protein
MTTTPEVKADRIPDKVEAGLPHEQRLSTGTLKPLVALIDHLGLAPHFLGDAVLHGADPVIRSPHRLGEASGMAQLLIVIREESGADSVI